MTRAFYTLFLHPLAQYPGPRLWAVSRTPFLIEMNRGRLPYKLKTLHDRHGSVIRVAPNEMSFLEPGAWRDIYQKQILDQPAQWGSKPPGVEAESLISAHAIDHARIRKVVAPAFSDKAVHDYESIVLSCYMDLMTQKIDNEIFQSRTKGSVTISLEQWLNFLTFDIIMDLGWLTTFKCLENMAYAPWIMTVSHFQALLGCYYNCPLPNFRRNNYSDNPYISACGPL